MQAKSKRFCVVIRKNYTQSQVGIPQWVDSMTEARQIAFEFNKHSNDHTWNCQVAYAVDTQYQGLF